MPVYLFTFHAYRSWMPDQGRGYVRRGEGILPTDQEMGEKYRERARDDQTVLNSDLQRSILCTAIEAAKFQRLQLNGGSTEPSHIHLLLNWRDERRTLNVRNATKQSLSRRLTKESGKQHFRLSGGASQKRVRDREHFEFLMAEYLPKHRGITWYGDKRGWIDQNFQ